MMGETPVFKSVSHALIIAYLLEFVESYAKGNLGRLIDIAAAKYGIDEPQVTSVHWGKGCNDLEKRGTAAMVRAAAERLLTTKQHTLVLARYSQDPKTKTRAICKIASEMAQGCKIDNRDTIAYMTCHCVHYGTPSGSEIARKFRTRKDVVLKDIRKIDAELKTIDKEIGRALRFTFFQENII
jgi:hypothetical protein